MECVRFKWYNEATALACRAANRKRRNPCRIPRVNNPSPDIGHGYWSFAILVIPLSIAPILSAYPVHKPRQCNFPGGLPDSAKDLYELMTRSVRCCTASFRHGLTNKTGPELGLMHVILYCLPSRGDPVFGSCQIWAQPRTIPWRSIVTATTKILRDQSLP